MQIKTVPQLIFNAWAKRKAYKYRDSKSIVNHESYF